MRARHAAVAALVLSACAHGGSGGRPPPLWSLADPLGDDHGDGDLTYPVRGDPAPGELDLISLRAFAAPGGTSFEATFARPIRRPDVRAISATGETLADRAPLGFYGFNLDVYVDVDRAPGSGRVDSIPGRKLAFAPECAWDRAIVLTPRASEATSVLTALWTRKAKQERGKGMSEREENALEREVAAEVARRVFFPREVRVSGATVAFFVPEEFLPGGAEPSYAYAAVVTGADMERRFDVHSLFGKDAPVPGLFVRPIVSGRLTDAFGGGRTNDPDQPPVVDLLSARAQEETLLARPPVVCGVVPAGSAAAPASR